MIKSIVGFICALPMIARAVEVYRLDSSLPGHISISVPYTLGTHTGRAAWPDLALSVDPARSRALALRIAFPIDKIDMGKEKMNCHLTEALGIDYAASRFPEKHACDRNHRLPARGPDSVVFPEIVFRAEPFDLPASHGSVVIKGAWTIHGIERSSEQPVNFRRNVDGSLDISGTCRWKLEDYGVIVKPFLAISVKGAVKADFQAKLRPVP